MMPALVKSQNSEIPYPVLLGLLLALVVILSALSMTSGRASIPLSAFADALTGAASGTVWDLLPNEHTAAWDPTVADRRIRVRFLDDVEKGGERTLVTVSHWNKLLKGALVRHVVERGLDDPEDLVGFQHPEGYRYEPSLTVVDGSTTEVALVARR